MAKRNKAKIVDGYTALRAAQRHVKDHAAPTSTAKESASTTDKPAPRSSVATHIAHTAMPTKLDIVCYACGYQFKMTGRSKHTLCPKCKEQLDLTDHTLTDVFDGELITAGTVRLGVGAVLDGGRITATDIVLEGTVKSGLLHAHKTLELAEGASLPEKLVQARHLRIATGMHMTFKRPVEFEDVDVMGELDASLTASGLVTIRAGGHLRGTLTTSHLAVEEGGGLSATVRVEPGAAPPPEKKKKASSEKG